MIEVYKILHGIYDTDISQDILQLVQDNRTRGHSLKLVTQHSKTEIRRNCFSVRVVKPWNALPEFVVSSRNIQIFESKDWTKHGKISQFVFATKKSSNFDYEDLDTEDLLCSASSTTDNDDDDGYGNMV